MTPSIARSIVFGASVIESAGKIAAKKIQDKAEKSLLSWIFLCHPIPSKQKSWNDRRRREALVRKDTIDLFRQVLWRNKIEKITIDLDSRKNDKNVIVFSVPEKNFIFFAKDCLVNMNDKWGSLFGIATSDLGERDCVLIAFAACLLHAHESKSPNDGNANYIRQLIRPLKQD